MHVVEFLGTIFVSEPAQEYRLNGTVINIHIQSISPWNIAVRTKKDRLSEKITCSPGFTAVELETVGVIPTFQNYRVTQVEDVILLNYRKFSESKIN